MNSVNIHAAKTHLSQLVEKAAKGEAVIIAKSGKPIAKLVAMDAPTPAQRKRIGFLAGQITVPDADAFNRMGDDEIAALFGNAE